MLQLVFVEPSEDRALRGLTLVPQRIMNEATFFQLGGQGGGGMQVGLIRKNDEKLSLFSLRSVLGHPGRDFAQGGAFSRLGWLANGARRGDYAEACCKSGPQKENAKSAPQRPDFGYADFSHRFRY